MKPSRYGWLAGCLFLALAAFPSKAQPTINSVYPPVINEFAGDHVAFQVSASGSGMLSYQWYQTNNLLASQTGTALILTNIQTSNSGQYEITVVDSSGIYVTNTVTLNVSTTNLQYYAGNLVVLRVGDGAQTLSGSGNTIYLDQYTTAGAYISSQMVPDESTGSNYGVGSSNSVYGSPALLLPGNVNDYLNCGMLTLSPSEQLLSFAAYCANYPFSGSDVTVGATGGAYWRGLATVNYTGQYKLTYTNSGLYSGGNHAIRSSTTLDATNFWTAGEASGGGVKYISVTNGVYADGTGIPSVTTASGIGAHVAQVFGTNLIYSDSSGPSGNGLYICYGWPEIPPNESTTASLFLKENGQPIDFAISPDGRTIYIADAGSFSSTSTPGGGVERWDTNTVLGGYSFSYTLQANGSGGTYGLTVAFPTNVTSWGSNVLGATVYATTPTSLISMIDNGPLSTASVLLSTVSYNEYLHGIRFCPLAPGPPYIVSLPQNITAGTGFIAGFKVGVVGATPLTYQWQFDGTNLANSSSVFGATTSSLTLSGITTNSSGTYQVIVSNSYGKASASATLNVVNAGTWTPLAHLAMSSIDTMLLLSDGTVLGHGAGTSSTSYKLTPDIHGSYINGTWSQVASMHYTRLYYSSDVLPNGQVFVAGGEYGSGTTNAEIYDPVSNVWNIVTVPPGIANMNNTVTNGSENNAGFMDSCSIVLTNGNVLITPVVPATNGYTGIYNPVSNSWSTVKLYRGNNEDEACLLMLADSSVLVIDFDTESSERYITYENKWINDTSVGVQMYDSYGLELGPSFLLPNGKAFCIGSAPNYAIYTPTGTTSPGSWVSSSLPNNLGAPDAPAAMMVNGVVLCELSPTPVSGDVFTTPTYFYEYNYSNGPMGSFTQVSAPSGSSTLNNVTYVDRMLTLPDGSMLFSESGSQLYVYKPYGPQLTEGTPTIVSITQNADGSFLLTGTGLNGLSQGAAYGDDAQMNSNYPLVRMTNNATGNVYYARTCQWSSTRVMTGGSVATTKFSLPSSLPAGSYSLVVIGNGFASAPWAFQNIPSLVNNGGFELGSFAAWTTSGNFTGCTVTQSAPYVHSGYFGAELGPVGSLGYLSETLSTTAGQMYQVSCWLYCAGGSPNEFSVSWNGATLFDEQNIGDTGWTNLQFLVEATNSSTTLTFGARNDTNDFGLDDISVYPVSAPQIQSTSMATNGSINLTWSAQLGQSYQVQYTGDLSSGAWTNLGGVIVTSNLVESAADYAAYTQRFYRVLLVP